MTTELGTNNWTSVRNLGVSDVAPVLVPDQEHAAITTFGPTVLLPTENGTYIAGIVDAGGDAWGAVVLVDRAGAITRVGHGVPKGLWVLEQAPDGTLWAGGEGAYRLQGDQWVRVWSAPKF